MQHWLQPECGDGHCGPFRHRIHRSQLRLSDSMSLKCLPWCLLEVLQNSILHQLRQNHGGDIQPSKEDHQGKGDRGAYLWRTISMWFRIAWCIKEPPSSCRHWDYLFTCALISKSQLLWLSISIWSSLSLSSSNMFGTLIRSSNSWSWPELSSLKLIKNVGWQR